MPTENGGQETRFTYDQFLNAGRIPNARADADQNLGNEFWYVRNSAEVYAPKARLICTLFYIIGGGFLAAVLIENFVYVASRIPWLL